MSVPPLCTGVKKKHGTSNFFQRLVLQDHIQIDDTHKPSLGCLHANHVAGIAQHLEVRVPPFSFLLTRGSTAQQPGSVPRANA